jgi:transposase-like protein
MPRKKKSAVLSETPSAAEPKIPSELLDQLITGPITQGEFETIFRALKKAVIERAMSAEMTEHLGYKRGEPKPSGQSNQRNGTSGKTVLTDDGSVDIEVPRDREGSYEPLIVGKHERRFTGFDQKIVAMYARGMTVREIQGYLADMYGTEVSPDFISKVTDEVLAEVTAWQSRPLEPMYPVVFFDALRVKIRDDAVVRNKAVYLALAVLPDGTRDVLGIWIEQTEGAKFLAEGVQRASQSRRQRHPHRRSRWAEGPCGRNHNHVSADHRSNLHRSPDPQ